MALKEAEQIKKLIADSKHILLVFSNSDTGDALACALAFKLFLEKYHKHAEVAASGFVLQKNFAWLPGATKVKPELAHLQKFIIKVDSKDAPIETLSYDIKDNCLSIYLTPKRGVISKSNLRTAQSTYKYDLIITIKTPDLNALGDIYLNNTDLFYRTPIINIDHEPSNERYGQINYLEFTSASICETVYNLLREVNEPQIDADIANCLLTGLMIATQSFKKENMTPQTLALGGQLINLGANREKIVKELYHTRSVAALKLWGAALTHLQHKRELNLVYTSVTRDDFARSGGEPQDLRDIMDELIMNSPETKLAIIFYEAEDDGNVYGLLAANKNYNALELTAPWQPEGNKKQARFKIKSKSLKEAEEMVLEIIGEILSAQGGSAFGQKK